MTKRTKLLLAVLVLVAILAHAYLYWWGHTPDHGYFDEIPFVKETSDKLSTAYPLAKTPIVTPTDKPATPAATETREYQDSEYKFNFQYPSDWAVNRSKVDDKVTYCLNELSGTGPCLLTITHDKDGVNANADAAWEAYAAQTRNQAAKESGKTIGGEEARIMTISGYAKGETGISRAAVFVHEDRIYTIEVQVGQEKVYDTLVSSLRFY